MQTTNNTETPACQLEQIFSFIMENIDAADMTSGIISALLTIKPGDISENEHKALLWGISMFTKMQQVQLTQSVTTCTLKIA